MCLDDLYQLCSGAMCLICAEAFSGAIDQVFMHLLTINPTTQLPRPVLFGRIVYSLAPAPGIPGQAPLAFALAEGSAVLGSESEDSLEVDKDLLTPRFILLTTPLVLLTVSPVLLSTHTSTARDPRTQKSDMLLLLCCALLHSMMLINMQGLA